MKNIITPISDLSYHKNVFISLSDSCSTNPNGHSLLISLCHANKILAKSIQIFLYDDNMSWEDHNGVPHHTLVDVIYPTYISIFGRHYEMIVRPAPVICNSLNELIDTIQNFHKLLPETSICNLDTFSN